jgi:CRP-like cAMP-binding protein
MRAKQRADDFPRKMTRGTDVGVPPRAAGKVGSRAGTSKSTSACPHDISVERAHMLSPLIRKFEQLDSLSMTEKQALRHVPVRHRQVRAHEDIVSEGERLSESSFILEGLACRYKLLPEGRRQIISFQISGDFCDLQGLLLSGMDHAVGALTRCVVAFISHRKLFQLFDTYPRIAQALWKETLIDGTIHHEWLANIGRRSAYARIAHLMCELWSRLKAAGLAQDRQFELPLTQTDIGDATGLSMIHVNRTLQQLRTDGLVTFHANVVTVHDWKLLQSAAEFDPSYLQLQPIPDGKIGGARRSR